MLSHADRDTRLPKIVAAAVAVAMVLASLLFYSETQEDAFITFRYSEHLAEGYGFGAWNTTGERVDRSVDGRYSRGVSRMRKGIEILVGGITQQMQGTKGCLQLPFVFCFFGSCW